MIVSLILLTLFLEFHKKFSLSETENILVIIGIFIIGIGVDFFRASGSLSNIKDSLNSIKKILVDK